MAEKKSNLQKRPSLTDSLVSKLEPSVSEYDIRDGDVKGFYVRIYPSGTKTYRCEYKKNKHYVIGRTNLLTAAQARLKAKAVMLDAINGLDPKVEEKKREAEEIRQRESQKTFKDFLEEKYKPYFEATYPKTAEAALKNIARNFLKSFGSLTLDQITQAKILDWRINRQKSLRKRIVQGKLIEIPVSAATVNRNIEQLSALFNQAIALGYIKENPATGIEKLSDREHKTRFLSSDEYQRLMEALDNREKMMRKKRDTANVIRAEKGYELYPDLKQKFFVDHLKPMVILALGSGIRFGSLCRLEWHKHIDFTHEDIIISLTADIVKGHKPKAYKVPLDEYTSNILKQWYEQTKTIHKGIGWVFPGKNLDKHITTVKKSWANLKQSAGIEDFTWHDQRHDFASQHVMSGTDLYTVMELLGHTDTKTTKKYAHLAVEHKIAAAKQLAERRVEMMKKNKK